MATCVVNEVCLHIRNHLDLQSSKCPVIVFSRQNPDIHSHGGCRRTAQIIAALSEVDVGIVSAEDYLLPSVSYESMYKDHKALGIVTSFLDKLRRKNVTSGLYEKWNESKREYLLHLNFVAQQWQSALKLNKQIKLAIIDDPVYFIHTFNYLCARNIPVVVTCQNIETLSASQMVPEYQRELFQFELNLFSRATLVVTISREETFLLNNMGIETLYLPYYPVVDIKERMLSIRESREKAIKRNFLLIGSVGNMPTMDGMVKFINKWQEMVRPESDADRLVVAGFGTEQLQRYVSGNRVELIGAVPNGQLDELLAQVKAAVVYQENGSGALTKICEFLVAGIPVFANQHAARSYYNLPGIIEFKKIEEVFAGFEQLAGIESKITIPVEPDYSELLSAVKAHI